MASISHDINREKVERLKRWITFYRRNIHRFIADYMGVHLHPYQIIMIWMLQNSTMFYAVASRASAKSWLIAVFSIAKAILYPGIKIVVCAKTQKQAGIIIEEKVKMINANSPNVQREIIRISKSDNGYMVEFKNGSSIKAVTSNENSRGNRANYIIVEESRLVPKEVLEEIIKPFFEFRTPPFRGLPEYKRDLEYREPTIISYITSAWYSDGDWYQDVKATLKRIAKGDKNAHFIALDFLISVYHGIKSKEMLINEMINSDRIAIRHEYFNLPSSTSSKSFFDLSYFRRDMNKAFYPQRQATYNPRKNPYAISKKTDELRIVSVDVATRSGKANDLTIISCIRLLPTATGYNRQAVYMESHSGMGITSHAKKIKEIFFDFESDYLVLDIQNVGASVFEELAKTTFDEERNENYPPFTLCEFNILEPNQIEDMLNRVTAAGALPVVFPISASQSLNSRIASEFRASLQQKKWQFLAHPLDAENYLISHQPEFLENPNDSSIYEFFMRPYAQTSAFIDECMNLEMSTNNGFIKLDRKNGRKDRYTSISYGNYLASFLDRDLIRESSYENEFKEMQDYIIVV